MTWRSTALTKFKDRLCIGFASITKGEWRRCDRPKKYKKVSGLGVWKFYCEKHRHEGAVPIEEGDDIIFDTELDLSKGRGSQDIGPFSYSEEDATNTLIVYHELKKRT